MQRLDSRPLTPPIAIDARAAARPELGGVERWAREIARACRRCARARYEVLRPRPRLVHRAGHAWEQLVLPLRAPARAAAAVPGQPRARRLAPHRARAPRRRARCAIPAGTRRRTWPGSGGCCPCSWPARGGWSPCRSSRARELAELLGADPGADRRRARRRRRPLHARRRPRAARRAHGLERPYVLCVASHTARKNLAALVPAARALAGRGRRRSRSRAATGRSSPPRRGWTS